MGNVLTWHNPKRGATRDVDPDSAFKSSDSSSSSNANGFCVNGVAWRTAPRAKDEAAHATLVSHFTAFASGDESAGHVLVHGAAGAGKRWLLMSSLGACLGVSSNDDPSAGVVGSRDPLQVLVAPVPLRSSASLAGASSAPGLCQFARNHPRGGSCFCWTCPSRSRRTRSSASSRARWTAAAAGGGRPTPSSPRRRPSPTALKPSVVGWWGRRSERRARVPVSPLRRRVTIEVTSGALSGTAI